MLPINANFTHLAPVPVQESVNKLIRLKPFEEPILSFVEALSNLLLKDSRFCTKTELVTLGFWLRKANIKRMQNLVQGGADKIMFPLGTVVHFTPANVDTMFLYSWICSLLMGNSNILRLTQSESEGKQLLLSALNELFRKYEFKTIAEQNVFITYPHDFQLHNTICNDIDARVMWGGDEAVNILRDAPVPPRCRDIAFADRYSAAFIDAEQIVCSQHVEEIAKSLAKEIQPYGQMACSSPKVVFWQGAKKSQDEVFFRLNQILEDTSVELNRSVNVLTYLQMLETQKAIESTMLKQNVAVFSLHSLRSEYLAWHYGQNVLLLLNIDDLKSINQMIDKKCQTLSYWGKTKAQMLNFVQNGSINKLDRVVPLGTALDFDTYWDGYDLLSQLSRIVFVK